MNFEIIYKMAKYLLCGASMFLVLKYVVNEDMPIMDISLITMIAILIFAIVDNGFSLVQNKPSQNQNIPNNSQCKTFCEMKEHMENVSGTENQPSGTTTQQNNGMGQMPNQSQTSGKSNVMGIAPASNGMGQMSNKQTSGKSNGMNTAQVPSNDMNQIPKNISEINVNSEEQTNDMLIQELNKEETIGMPEDISTEEPKVKDKRSDYRKFQDRFAEIIDDRTSRNKEFVIESDKMARNDDASYTMHYKRRSPQIRSKGSRPVDDVVKDEVQYNITSYHTVPPNVNEGSFEYGYSFLPPVNWYPTPPHPPVCVAEKRCPVCPVYTTGTNLDLKEWDSARRISAPDEINVDAIEEKLNSGR